MCTVLQNVKIASNLEIEILLVFGFHPVSYHTLMSIRKKWFFLFFLCNSIVHSMDKYRPGQNCHIHS